MITITQQEAQTIVQVIDVASARGAFRGAEMHGIGTLYNKLATELQKLNPAPEPKANKGKVSVSADVKKEV